MKQLTATVATGTCAPLWNSESVGQDLERPAIVGNLTRPFSMLTSCATISGRMQWSPSYQANTNSTCGESFSRFSSEFFARDRFGDGSFSRLVFSGWNPTYLRTHSLVPKTSLYPTTILSTLHLSFVSSGGPASERRGYCDSVVRTGTSCTGSVRTEYVLTLSVLPVPAVLLVYLSLIPPGISGSAITGYSSSGV